MNPSLDLDAMLAVALAEARLGLAEGGLPIGAAIFDDDGNLLSKGHNRHIQDGDPSSHGETDAFRKAGRQETWRDKIMVTTLTPCWFCSGLVRQFGFPAVVIGDTLNLDGAGGEQWLRDLGVVIVDLASAECIELMTNWKRANPEMWAQDGGASAMQS